MDVAYSELLKCQNETFWNSLIPCCEVLNALNLTSKHDEYTYISIFFAINVKSYLQY